MSFKPIQNDFTGLTQNNTTTASSAASAIQKSESKPENPRPRPAEPDKAYIPKRPRPTPPPPAPRASYPQPEEDIEVIAPVVKAEPRDTTPSMQANNQNMVQQEQEMAMYDVTQQQDTVMEQYDDSYGGDYEEQYDQGYDGSMQQGGQDTAAAAGNISIER